MLHENIINTTGSDYAYKTSSLVEMKGFCNSLAFQLLILFEQHSLTLQYQEMKIFAI